ncbi:olee1-like protein [Abrus precatorius]|uniref:Olee1-like protein n=1 Tax=Abrus precatorius TaxID=3816 RepID=A0A8B8KJV0_ABRPR|nr:olee1-like protein [Abrus precatorius]
MEKSFAVALLVSAFCFSSALARNTPADSNDTFFVEGKIYCDPCRFEFESRLSYPLADVKITLQCTKEESDNVILVKEAKTDANGKYSIPVDGDHEEERCMVTAEAPTEGKCKSSMTIKSDRILLTTNMGVSSLARYANPLGFMTQTADPQCSSVVSELELDKFDD